MHVVIAIIHHSPLVRICQYIQCTDPLWLQRLMLQDYLTTSYVRVTISTLNFAVGVDGNPQPCYFRYFGLR